MSLSADLLTSIPATTVVLAVCLGALCDLRGFRLPNWLTFPMIITGLVWQTLLSGISGAAWSGVGILVAGAPLLYVHLRGGMGAGDVKLMAGVGAWMGAWFSLHVIMVAGLASGFPELLRRLISRNHPTPSAVRMVVTSEEGLSDAGDAIERALRTPAGRRGLIPFGLMIAVGVCINLMLPDLQRLAILR